MTTRHDVQRLIRQCWEAPYGPSQIALADEAIRHADAFGDPEVRFEARLAATEAYQMGGEPAKTFVTFSWCLAEYDANPGRYGAREDGLLRWYFKWVAGSLCRFPEVPLSRTYAVLDDMERRYRLGGHSLQAVYQHRWLVASHIGDTVAANDWYERWISAPRDENSDCAGCDPTNRVEHLAECDRDAEAVALAEPILAGQLTCAEQPQAILTALLLPYLRTDRLDEARNAHIRAYRAHRHQRADLASIADHVLFCGLTGNEARGLELIDRHFDWLDRPPSPFAELEFAGAAAFLLNRPAVRNLRLRDGKAGELADRLASRATDLAARFDARNGTSHRSTLLRNTLSAEPIVDYLPLTAVAKATAATRVPSRNRPAAVEALPEGPLALLDLINEAQRAESAERVEGLLSVLDERHPELSTDLAARRADERARWLANVDRMADAEREFGAAIAGYHVAGDEPRLYTAQARLGLLLCVTGRADDGLALVDEATVFADAHGDPPYRASAHLRRCDAMMATERYDEAQTAVEVVLALAAEDRLTVEALARRAHLLHLSDRTDDALSAASMARDLGRTLGPGHTAAMASFQHGELLLATDDNPAAAAAFAEAIELGATGGLCHAAHANRGKALSASGHAADAVPDLIESVAGFVAAGAAAPAAYARFDLAIAYHRAGQHLEAAEAAEEAVRALDAINATDAADRCRYLLSYIYRSLNEPEQALAQLDELARRLDGFDNLQARANMLEEAGQIMYRRDQDLEAAGKFAAAAQAYSAAGQVVDEARSVRWQALSLRWAERREEALAALARVDALVANLSEDLPGASYEKAMLGYDAARVLIGAERLDDALDRVRPVAQRFRAIEAYAESVQADMLHGEVLLRMGRSGEAEPLLRSALGAAPRDSDLCQNAAWMLAEALDGQGRTEEATAVRRKHGLE